MWSFHHIGIYNNVFDPCAELSPTSPRVPCNENIDDPYKTDLLMVTDPPGTWDPRSTFLLGQMDPYYGRLSEVD